MAAENWLVLRCSGTKTIALAKALERAGYPAWTPVEMVKRQPRPLEPWERNTPARARKKPVKVTRPILSSFVFADARYRTELINLSRSPQQQYQVWDREKRKMVWVGIPYFSLPDATSTIPDVQLEPLRRAAGERPKAAKKKKSFKPGTPVRLTDGAYEGLRGTVVRTEGNLTIVDFGAAFFVPKIQTRLLTEEVDATTDSDVNSEEPDKRAQRHRNAA